MTWEVIRSRENPLIRDIKKLAVSGKYRRERGLYLCEGEKLLREALQSGITVPAVLWEESALQECAQAAPDFFRELLAVDCRLIAVPAALFQNISILETGTGPLFLCTMPAALPTPKAGGNYIVLDALQDPGNLGTVIRTADALGVSGVFLLEGTADPYQPKVVRGAMGSLFRVPVYRETAADFFDTMGRLSIPVYAAVLAAESKRIQDVPLRGVAVLIGNEGRGVAPENQSRCNGKIIIPMSGSAESLNAAVSAAIIMWEMSRCL